MFRVQYDTSAPDATFDADTYYVGDDGLIQFSKGDQFVAAVASISVLAIIKVSGNE